MDSAQIKMKALVISRLMMGAITKWEDFEQERTTASQIVNRHTARSVSAQIGRGYRELSQEIRSFIDRHFEKCKEDDLARLCDAMQVGAGLSLRLHEFEKEFFQLAASVKGRVPLYSHVHISTFGLQFEFPEHHFLRDIEIALPELLDVRSKLAPFERPEFDAIRERDVIAGFVAKEKFLCRSIISATFSLIEAFLSGLFFTGLDAKALGNLVCDDEFLQYARTRESAPLRDRLDRIVRFTSKKTESGTNEPFKTLMEIGKRYRDAIHHTTPFERKDIERGGRLTALYEINSETAFRCIMLSCVTIVRILRWISPESDATEIESRCKELIQKADTGGIDVSIPSLAASA